MKTALGLLFFSVGLSAHGFGDEDKDAGLLEIHTDEIYEDIFASDRGGHKRKQRPGNKRREQGLRPRPNVFQILASQFFSGAENRNSRPAPSHDAPKRPSFGLQLHKTKPTYHMLKSNYGPSEKKKEGLSYHKPKSSYHKTKPTFKKPEEEEGKYGALQKSTDSAPAPSYKPLSYKPNSKSHYQTKPAYKLPYKPNPKPKPQYKPHKTSYTPESKPTYALAPAAPAHEEVNGEYGSLQAPTYNRNLLKPSYEAPESSYESPEPVNIEPAYEPEFPVYKPPETPDLTHDDGKEVKPYSAGEDVFEQPAGLDDFPAFPRPAFPDVLLKPIFDKEVFENFQGTESQYEAPAPKRGSSSLIAPLPSTSNSLTYQELSYSAHAQSPINSVPSPLTSYSLASTALSYSENSQSPGFSYPVQQPNYAVASLTFSAEPVLPSSSQPGLAATQALPEYTAAQPSLSLSVQELSSPAPAKQPSYSPAAPAVIFSPTGKSSSYSPKDDDKYGTSHATFWNAEPKEDENERPDATNNKRQATGFPLDKHSVFTKAAGIPDIWDIFSEEWGQRISGRMDGTDLKRNEKQVNFF